MFIVYGERGIGKTKKLIEQAVETNGIIACRDPEHMRARAHSYGITGLTVVSYEELANRKIVHPSKPVYIHDINSFIEYNFQEVKGFTICTED
jgi:hypothetical protein